MGNLPRWCMPGKRHPARRIIPRPQNPRPHSTVGERRVESDRRYGTAPRSLHGKNLHSVLQQQHENPAQGYNWTCHWLLVYETKNNGRTTGMFAFDFDSQLGLNVPAKNYFSQSFPRGGYNDSIYFRLFQADQYVQMNKKLAAKNPYWYLNKGTPLAYNAFMSMLV